jgi:hypothetical protein
VGGQAEENRGWEAGFGSDPKPTLTSRRDRQVLFAARHQRVLADNSPRDQRRQHVEGAPAALDWLAVDQELAAMRQHSETTERDTRRYFGDTFHQLH